MNLDKKDFELIERLVYKSGDDIAVSIARGFERLEERMDAMETRLTAQFDKQMEINMVGIEKELEDIRSDLWHLIKPDEAVDTTASSPKKK